MHVCNSVHFKGAWAKTAIAFIQMKTWFSGRQGEETLKCIVFFTKVARSVALLVLSVSGLPLLVKKLLSPKSLQDSWS